MKLAVLKERRAGEARVAATPETAKKLTGLGLSVVVESGAGAGARIADADYVAAGAAIAPDAAAALADADIVFTVRGPDAGEIAAMKKGTVLAALLAPHSEKDTAQTLAAQGVTAFAMEFIPRISRAQAMDVLSSQANLAGYKAVIDAAATFGRAFPMMMTAAGTIAPARAFIMGVGVAGLQAIATARRLGAIVSATDVRPATREQVESLGATFVAVMDDEFKQAETAAGYAKEMSKDYQEKQAALIAETIRKQDIVITTALIPGRSAPVLVTEEMVKTMKPGSVIVDLAAEQGGNCPLTKADQVVEAHGVTIMGYTNLASRLAVDTSSLYARNLFNFVSLLVDKKTGALNLNWDDEILKGAVLTRDGEIVHPAVKG
ncbi:MAG: Re/Si-specific NAD(P)(+) transhydrogenase subunit alpha [Alphaproteobacteria bacterium]|nr:Re/Si-specific NAD(P)(+) transhydrogenase subunit alpha [Alphaproteobacteria bacterium]OJU56755.1 MAG: NAD(P) transhydrogenase subunit alpha [Alphaproteobacteria bacterium 62-8]MBN9567871.1 Re/Si-specific NAD(P)(+) transhydrogenase subunit alpha [Alphaproteobacteria bacterium]MBN9571171.1 Re/Si-specific NAD(P)(+) transhydrogenase subunit alpha [Alphaproteobacteria bacterium]MBN9577435.1 Re/Si-specific NAD(P)(+) transhydrogenase subunit alpha [Alphaproteobacteria bacterium]